MEKISEKLLSYMTKWGGKTGILVLAKECKKLGIRELEGMDEQTRIKLLKALTREWLVNFLSQRRYNIARSELLSVLELPFDSFKVYDGRYNRPRSPILHGKLEE